MLSANAICEIGVTVSENKDIEVIGDAYLIGREARAAYERLAYLEEVSCLHIDTDVTHKASRAELGISEAREIVLISAEPRIDEKEIAGERVDIKGSLRISGVACEISAAAEPVYVPFKTDAPFSVSLNCGSAVPDGAEPCLRLWTGDVECTLEPDSVSVSVELLGDVRVTLAHSMERLASCSAVGDEKSDTPPSEIVVYYPDADETLYDVSKLHRVRMADVAASCGISAEASTHSLHTPLRSLGIKHIMLP